VHEGSTSQRVEAMRMDGSGFRDGGFDRPSAGRRIGP
jgi:hypothetical protein